MIERRGSSKFYVANVSIYSHGGFMAIGYIWTEEQFIEDNHIVYRVRSLSYPSSIALIKVSATEYKIYKSEHQLKLAEELMLFKIAEALLDEYRFKSRML